MNTKGENHGSELPVAISDIEERIAQLDADVLRLRAAIEEGQCTATGQQQAEAAIAHRSAQADGMREALLLVRAAMGEAK